MQMSGKTVAENVGKQCEKAAHAIWNSQIFLLATGAGFSADSGLAVYKDIANVQAYHKLNLTYANLCDPKWLDKDLKDRELFYGFWGSCFNDYRNTKPHEGYHIALKWRDMFLQKSGVTKSIRKKQLDQNNDSDLDAQLKNPETSLSKILKKLSLKKEKKEKKSNNNNNNNSSDNTNGDEEVAGPFFIYTSNVDAHSQKVGFHDHEVYAIHGITEYWQCGNPSQCTEKHLAWKAPQNFQFQIDKESMLAPHQPNNTVVSKGESGDVADNNGKKNDRVAKAFSQNHPTCIACSGLARPQVLMFGDYQWKRNKEEERRYHLWQESAVEIMKSDSTVRLVIVEIGCGLRVPSVRYHTESLLQNVTPKGQCTLIRINPDFPEVEVGCHVVFMCFTSERVHCVVDVQIRPELQPKLCAEGETIPSVISIRGTALETLRAIDQHLELLSRSAQQQ